MCVSASIVTRYIHNDGYSFARSPKSHTETPRQVYTAELSIFIIDSRVGRLAIIMSTRYLRIYGAPALPIRRYRGAPATVNNAQSIGGKPEGGGRLRWTSSTATFPSCRAQNSPAAGRRSLSPYVVPTIPKLSQATVMGVRDHGRDPIGVYALNGRFLTMCEKIRRSTCSMELRRVVPRSMSTHGSQYAGR